MKKSINVFLFSLTAVAGFMATGSLMADSTPETEIGTGDHKRIVWAYCTSEAGVEGYERGCGFGRSTCTILPCGDY